MTRAKAIKQAKQHDLCDSENCHSGEDTWQCIYAHALLEEVKAREKAEFDRDLAIAHDRQPYPTAEAYELACAALKKQRERAEKAEAQLSELGNEYAIVCHWKQRVEELEDRILLLEGVLVKFHRDVDYEDFLGLCRVALSAKAGE